MSVETPQTPTKNSWSEYVNKGDSNTRTQKAANPTNLSTIEPIVGFVIDTYECVHNNFAGTMYVGPLAVVWLGRVFFFEWTVVLKWEDVAKVQKINNGVSIVVRNPKPGTYDFVKLFNAEKAFGDLLSVHNDSIMGKPRTEPTPKQKSRSIRRRNSDPLKMSLVFNLDGPPTIFEDDIISMSRSDDSDNIRQRQRYLHRTSSAPVAKELNVVVHSLSDESLDDTHLSAAPPATPNSLKKQWSEVLASFSALSEVAVSDHELPCDLDRFLALFVLDGAEFPIPSFMSESGDEGIQCSPWQKASDGTHTRTVEYTHPINAPMAPPMARARKEQTYRSYGRHGIVLETRTYVADVPMTDCFFVADQILVQPVGNKISLKMSFNINFIKSTMFESIISRTTRSEFQGFMQRLAAFMSKSLGESTVAVPVGPPIAEIHHPPETFWEFIETNSTEIILVIVVILQLWIMLDLRSVRREVWVLQLAFQEGFTPIPLMEQQC